MIRIRFSAPPPAAESIGPPRISAPGAVFSRGAVGALGVAAVVSLGVPAVPAPVPMDDVVPNALERPLLAFMLSGSAPGAVAPSDVELAETCPGVNARC